MLTSYYLLFVYRGKVWQAKAVIIIIDLADENPLVLGVCSYIGSYTMSFTSRASNVFF